MSIENTAGNTASKTNTSKTNITNVVATKTETFQIPEEFNEKRLAAAFESVRKEVTANVPNMETKEGRKHIKDLGTKINKSMKVIDEPIREYLKELKAAPKIVEAIAKASKDRFDTLRAEILKPLEDGKEEQLKTLNYLANVLLRCNDPAETSSTLTSLQETVIGGDYSHIWDENTKKFKTAYTAAQDALELSINRKKQEEDQAAELERLRQERLESEIRERERERVREEEREKARKETREEVEIQVAKVETVAQQEKAEAVSVAIQQGAQSVAKEYEQKQQEQKAIADERSQDAKHRAAVNRAAMQAIVMRSGISEPQAKEVVMAIIRGQVPNVAIHY